MRCCKIRHLHRLVLCAGLVYLGFFILNIRTADHQVYISLQHLPQKHGPDITQVVHHHMHDHIILQNDALGKEYNGNYFDNLTNVSQRHAAGYTKRISEVLDKYHQAKPQKQLSDDDLPDHANLKRAGLNPRCHEYPLVSPHLDLGKKTLSVGMIFSTKFLYPTFMDMSACPHSKCHFKTNATHFPEEADFVIFLLSSIQTTLDGFLRSVNFTGRRDPRQRWVLLNQESPEYSMSNRTQLSQLEGIFNFTIHYSSQADIVFPYGECYHKNKTWDRNDINQTVNWNGRHLLGKNKPTWDEIRKNFLDKKWAWKTGNKMPKHKAPKHTHSGEISFTDVKATPGCTIFWISSHCDTVSLRENYVKDLKTHMKVDIYGRCGNRTLKRCPWGRNHMKCHNAVAELYNQYKFILAFENSFCDEYVTEKVFRIMLNKYHIIPVVLGAGPYEQVLPPGSYIDARKLSSPKALADYLIYLNNTPEEFDKYFKWRDVYGCDMFTPNSCLMCEALEQLKQRRNVVTYQLSEILGKENCA